MRAEKWPQRWITLSPLVMAVTHTTWTTCVAHAPLAIQARLHMASDCMAVMKAGGPVTRITLGMLKNLSELVA